MKINYLSTAGNFCVSELAQFNRHELEQPPGWFLSLPKGSIRAHLTHSLHLLSTAPEAAAPPGAPPRGLEGIFSLIRTESPFIPHAHTYSVTG